MVGNVDAGKSTLLGVLTHGELDNGRGHARQRLFRHKHEMESGRTSSVGNDILGTLALKGLFNFFCELILRLRHSYIKLYRDHLHQMIRKVFYF